MIAMLAVHQWIRVAALFPLCSWAEPLPEFSGVFQSSMVLPAGRAFPVTGRATPGERVMVTFGNTRAHTIADADGSWRAGFPAMQASSTPKSLTARTTHGTVMIDDVLVGEVWLCAGQSNMDFPLGRAVGGSAEVARSGDFAGIRMLDLSGVATSARRYNDAEMARMNPANYYAGRWQKASPDSVSGFSAVAWWAGKRIHEARKVPVGLIDVSVGGSGAEAWLPRERLLARAAYAELLEDGWLESDRVSSWARGRASLNLAGRGVNHPFRPGFLFEAGVRGWRGSPLSGVMWYQGETNAEIHDDEWNETLITDLVSGWREVLEMPDLPFFMVQLPRIGGNDPLRKWWPEFRAVQARAVSKLDGVTLVETQDLGWDSPDVHPPDKKPVGQRLGQAVLDGGGSGKTR
jgi:sialate O-acetylesterase